MGPAAHDQEEDRMRFVTALAAAAFVGTITFAQSITYDFDATANFSRFKTYAWISGTSVPDALNHQRIVAAISTQLGSKGLTRIDREANPDLYVAYHAAFDRDLQITGFGSGWSGFRLPGSYSGSARAEEILKGMLLVDVMDTRTRVIVWRGIAAKDIDVNAKPDEREKNINKTAEKMFKNYPPPVRKETR
jgi:hypothetical protein